MESCPLCMLPEADILLRLNTVLVFRSPFGSRWPGALMAVFKAHICELSDARKPSLASAELLAIERAIRLVCKPKRMNVVKFSNACEHLHWHLIPRFTGELYPTQSPWELLNHSYNELYHASAFAELPNDACLPQLIKQMHFEISNPLPNFFAAALFFKHKNNNYKLPNNINDLITLVRNNSSDFQVLLMQRNYGAFEWDLIGGMANRGEVPEQTLHREVHEETNWQINTCSEVLRQWNAGVLRGFIYVSTIKTPGNLYPELLIVANSEVKKMEFISLEQVLTNPMFCKVKPRLQTFLEGKKDVCISEGAVL